MTFENIVNSFLKQANKTAIYSLNSNQETSNPISYSDLYHKIHTLKNHFNSVGVKQQHVCLIISNPQDSIAIFFALALLGNTIVLYDDINDTKQAELYVKNLLERVSQAQCSTIIAKLNTLDVIKTASPDKLNFIAYESALNAPTQLSNCPSQVADIVMIQYSSGSTGEPKGVMLSEYDILNNVDCTSQAWKCRADDIALSWTPFSHLYGFATGILLPLYCGATLYHMQPFDVVSNPASWLSNIAKYKVTISGGMNFIYELCTNHFDMSSVSNLDLHNWRIAVIAGDVVKQSTLNNFIDTFKKYAFNPDALCPAYGATETAGFITAATPGEYSSDHISSQAKLKDVGLGHPLKCNNVLIIDHNNSICTDGESGEVIVSGPTFHGYYKRPELNADTYLQLDGSAQKFCRTGDIGYKLKDKIFLLGRKKDVIIQQGKKYYPVDFESILYKKHDLFSNLVVVFSHLDENKNEKIIVVQSIKQKPIASLKDLEKLIRKTVSTSFSVNVDEIIFIYENEFPKTKAGKINRNQIKTLYSTNQLSKIEQKIDDNESQIEFKDASHKELKQIWSEILKINDIANHDSFFELGGSSIRSLECICLIKKRLHKNISVRELTTNSTLLQLHELLSTKPRVKSDSSSYSYEEFSNNPFPVSALQKRLINFYAKHVSKYCAIQAFEFTSMAPEAEKVRAAIQWIINANLSLQLGIKELATGEYVQQIRPNKEQFEFRYCDFQGLAEEDKTTLVKEHTSKILNDLDVFNGPTVSVGYFKNYDRLGQAIVIFNGSHIFSDAGTGDILLEQLGKYLSTETPPALSFDNSYYNWCMLMQQLEKKEKNEFYTSWHDNLVHNDYFFPVSNDYDVNLKNSDRVEEQVNIPFPSINKLTSNIEHLILLAFSKAVFNVFKPAQKEISFHLQFNARAIPTFELNESFLGTTGTFNEVFPVSFTQEIKQTTSSSLLATYQDKIRNLVDSGINYCIYREAILADNSLSQKGGRDTFKTRLNIYKITETQMYSDNLIMGDRARNIWAKTRTYSGDCDIEYLLDYSILIFPNRLSITVLYSKYHYTRDDIVKITENIVETIKHSHK